MPCQTQSSQQPQQPTTVLPQNLPQTQADWQRFLQRMNELLGSINNAQYATGVNAVPTEYAVYDGTALPSLRITGATSAFDTSHVQFGAGSLKLTATASTVTVELAASGYPITLHPNWKWIASLFLLTSASNIAGKLSVVTPAQQYDADISGTPGASWVRLYGDYDLTADASTSCTLLLTLTGVTVGQVFNIEGWMLEPSQGAVLPSPFIMTSGPRTWTQVVGSDAVNTNITTAQTTATSAQTTATQANTTANNAQPAAIVNPGFDQGMYGWTPESDAANWYPETGTNGPDAGTTTYMVHQGSNTTTFLRNAFRAPVVPGQIIKATCKVRGISSPTGTPAIRILFQDINNTDIAGSPVTSGAVGNGVQLLSVIATAPSNAAYATISPGVGFGTGGYYNFDDMAWTYQPNSLDEVPNGSSGTRNAVAAIDGSGLALIDFSQAGHTNKILDNIADGTNYVRMMQQIGSGSAWLIDNALFQNWDHGSNTTVPGWIAQPGCSVFVNSTNQVYGTYCLSLLTSSGAANWATYYKKIPVKPGDYISLTALINAYSGAGTYVAITFYTAAGAQISPQLLSPTVTTAGWTSVQKSGQVPSNAAYAQITLQSNGGGAYYSLFQFVQVTVNDIRVAGSGAQVGDQRNLKQRTVTNYPSKVAPTISYSASAGTPATATISATAFTALLGSVSVPYNASSTSVTGTNGTNSSYYLYFNDPTYSGGTQMLVATTNQNDLYSGDGYAYVGYVTVAFPSSGSGSGGGTGCPEVEEPVIRRLPDGSRQVVRAGDIDAGDDILLFDGRWGRVSYSERKSQPGVHVIGEDDSSITCSESAPLETDDGPCVRAADVEGLSLRHRRAGSMRIKAVIPLGPIWVQHITCENACFVVGDYSHHNAKPP